MLVLLVTLIVSLPIMTHAVKLDMPQNKNQPPPICVPRSSTSSGLRRHGGLERTVVQNVDQLEGYFRQESNKEPQPEIHLRPTGARSTTT